MKNDTKKKIISVNFPEDLLDIMDHSMWHNRSKMIVDAVEEYIKFHDPSLYKLLEVMRNA